MKISEMAPKTSLEVGLDDLMAIEDEEDTKSIKMSELLDFINRASERHTKVYMNQLFDEMIKKLSEAKFVVAEVSHYLMRVWINEPGIVNIALLDMSDSHWLTSTEIGDVIINGTLKITMTVGINEIPHDSYTVMDYPTDGTGESLMLEEAGAGYIRADFYEINQNETATVTHKDISMEMRDAEGHPLDLYDPTVTTSLFETSSEAFINTVPFVSAI